MDITLFGKLQSLVAVVAAGVVEAGCGSAAAAIAERNSIKPSENNHRCEIVFIRSR